MAWRDDLILPEQPVRLTAAEVEELARRFAGLRGEILDYVALIEELLQSPNFCADSAGQGHAKPQVAAELALSKEQIDKLYECLATTRHDINGQGAVIVAVIELVRLKPGEKQRLLAKLATVPAMIAASLTRFCSAFEETFGVLPAPVRRQPSGLPRDAESLAHELAERPALIRERIRLFSEHLERALQIRRRSQQQQIATRGC